MKTEQLQSLTDDELNALIAEAQGLLKERKEGARQKAIADAKERLAAVGLTFRDVIGKSAPAAGGKKRKATQPLKQGERYANPANPKEVYTVGRGRRPKWFADLEAKGQTPAPEAAGRK